MGGGPDPGDADWSDVLGYAQDVALGDGSLPDEYAETHKLKFRRDSLQRKGLRPGALQVYYGSGDSMEPRIHDGDAILFDTSDTRVVDNRIYVVRYEGHVYAKRLQVHGDLVFIESDNDTDPKWRRPVLVREGDDFEVIGRVRWIGSWED
nr:S24 family peptidase [Lysobacter sp. GX 14042]